MAAVARHLRLPTHPFDLHLAYNTKGKRGLQWRGRANAVPREHLAPPHSEYTERVLSRGGGGAPSLLPSLNGSEAGASEATMRTLRRLMAPSVSTVMARSKQ